MMALRLRPTPLRAPLGAARQALLASPSSGEVNSTRWHDRATSTRPTLPLEGLFAGRRQNRSSGAILGEKAMRATPEWLVVKLGPQGRSGAREGVSAVAVATMIIAQPRIYEEQSHG